MFAVQHFKQMSNLLISFHTVFSLLTVYVYLDSLYILLHNIKRWLNILKKSYDAYSTRFLKVCLTIFSLFLKFYARKCCISAFRSSFLRVSYIKDVLKDKTSLPEFLFNKFEGL